MTFCPCCRPSSILYRYTFLQINTPIKGLHHIETCIYHQGKEPSVRQLALLHFRNTITLNLKLDEALSRPRARVPPSIIQMLLILQVSTHFCGLPLPSSSSNNVSCDLLYQCAPFNTDIHDLMTVT